MAKLFADALWNNGNVKNKILSNHNFLAHALRPGLIRLSLENPLSMPNLRVPPF